MRISDWSSDVCSSDLILVTDCLLQTLDDGFNPLLGPVVSRPFEIEDEVDPAFFRIWLTFSRCMVDCPLLGFAIDHRSVWPRHLTATCTDAKRKRGRMRGGDGRDLVIGQAPV